MIPVAPRSVLAAIATIAAASCVPSPPASSVSPTNAAARASRRVVFLHVADTHAQLETHAEYVPGQSPELQRMGGYARLRTAIDRERKSSGASAAFVVDGGDTFQGSGPAASSAATR